MHTDLCRTGHRNIESNGLCCGWIREHHLINQSFFSGILQVIRKLDENDKTIMVLGMLYLHHRVDSHVLVETSWKQSSQLKGKVNFSVQQHNQNWTSGSSCG